MEIMKHIANKKSNINSKYISNSNSNSNNNSYYSLHCITGSSKAKTFFLLFCTSVYSHYNMGSHRRTLFMYATVHYFILTIYVY